MKKNTKKVVKRDIYNSNSRNKDKPRSGVSGNENKSDCVGTAIVYCNQWECYTRFICLDKESDKQKQIGST